MRLPRLLHSAHLERWLGAECVAQIADSSHYATFPQYVCNVPGEVYALGGDFYGSVRRIEYGLRERTLDAMFSRPRADEGVVYVPPLAQSSPALAAYAGAHMVLASRSDAINKAASGKLQQLLINKVGVTGVAAAHNTLWYEGTVPVAGALPGNLPTGTDHTRTSAGALGPQVNPTGGDQLYLSGSQMLGTVGSNTLLLYDRLWSGVIDRTVATAQTVTPTLLRHNTTVANSTNNFAFVEIQTVLPATAHNITLQYVDQDGNAAENAAAVAGLASGIAKRLDHAGWSIPLNAGDVGFRDLTQITLSATLASGTLVLACGNFKGYMPCPVANTMPLFDFLSGPLNPPEILADACLSLLEVSKGATTATTYVGAIVLLSG